MIFLFLHISFAFKVPRYLLVQKYEERLELARKSERKWLRTRKFKGLCESIQIQQGCHIIILTDKYYVGKNKEILFTLHQILRNTDKQGGWRGVADDSSPPEMPINTGDLGGKVKSEEIFAEC